MGWDTATTPTYGHAHCLRRVAVQAAQCWDGGLCGVCPEGLGGLRDVETRIVEILSMNLGML